MNFLSKYQQTIAEAIENHKFTEKPAELYEPMNYILDLGGKRLRPVMTLMACELFGGDIQKALKPALAVEFFHNFTLMHDDIMDNSPLRRGKKTVHTKYGENTAILSGDALLVQSYRMFEDLDPVVFKNCIRLFSETAAKLCEGQQYDMNFETQQDVDYQEYIKMITGKTAVLCACALKLGAVVANANPQDAENLYKFGENLGIAFQLRDDYLDLYGNQNLTGKKRGGDICENKKSALYILAMQNASNKQEKEIKYRFGQNTESKEKLDSILQIFNDLQVEKKCSEQVKKYHENAFVFLEKIPLPEEKKKPLAELAHYLLEREN